MFYIRRHVHVHDDDDGHLEHVLHVVLHLPESRPSAGLPLPALPHQAEQGFDQDLIRVRSEYGSETDVAKDSHDTVEDDDDE